MNIKAIRMIGTQVLNICGKIINFSLVNIPIFGDVLSNVSIEAFNMLISKYKYKNDLKDVLHNVDNLSQDVNIGSKLNSILMEIVVPENVELTERQRKKFEKLYSKSLCDYAVSRKLSGQKVDKYLANSKTFNNLTDDEKKYIVNAVETIIQIYIKEQFDNLSPNERVLAAAINESFSHGIENLESILQNACEQNAQYNTEIINKLDQLLDNKRSGSVEYGASRENADRDDTVDFEETDIGNVDLGDLFEQVAKGDAEAEFNLAQCYYKGVLVARSDSKAVEYYKKSAQHGNVKALYNLGQCAEHGIFLKKDEAEAFGYYMSAAKAGNAKAQSALAECYLIGTGIDCDKDEAEKWYKKSAQQGNSEAQAALGSIYFSRDDEKNNEEMIRLLSAATDKGETLAIFMLAKCYELGKGVKQDMSMSYDLYKRAADNGDDDARFMLGLFHFNGVFGVQDFEQALKWFSFSAENGNGCGQAYAGLLYLRGMGVEIDEVKGWDLINKSVAQDNMFGNCIMAACKFQGIGCKVDLDSAFYFAQRAARQGNIEALYYLGVFYIGGIGCGEDFKKGISYMIDAALRNYVPAIMELEQIYNSKGLPSRLKKFIEVNYFQAKNINGSNGVSNSEAERKIVETAMIETVREKAEAGDAMMQCQYAVFLINGKGADKDIDKGIALLNAAKAQDCLQAYTQLAHCYLEGIGVDKDKDKALELAEYAAAKGDVMAQDIFVELLFDNTLDDENKSKNAFEKLLWLAEKGNKRAQYRVGRCYLEGCGIGERKETAFNWFLKAAKQGEADAQYFLANCYETGYGTHRDYIKAIIWYAKAAEKSNVHAEFKLGEMFSRGDSIAIDFYLHAALNGVAMAKYKLGYFLEFGKGTEVDLNEALKWYKEAAEDNVSAAPEAIARVEEKIKNNL